MLGCSHNFLTPSSCHLNTNGCIQVCVFVIMTFQKSIAIIALEWCRDPHFEQAFTYLPDLVAMVPTKYTATNVQTHQCWQDLMAQARKPFLLPIRQVEKAMWKGNKAQAWPDAILWPMNMYLPNEATKIMDLLGMKTNLFQVHNPKGQAKHPCHSPGWSPVGCISFCGYSQVLKAISYN